MEKPTGQQMRSILTALQLEAKRKGLEGQKMTQWIFQELQKKGLTVQPDQSTKE